MAKYDLDFGSAAPLSAPSGQLLAAPDVRINDGEDRFLGFGRLANRVVAVCCTLRGQVIRLISLRKANERETKKYEQALEKVWREQSDKGRW